MGEALKSLCACDGGASPPPATLLARSVIFGNPAARWVVLELIHGPLALPSLKPRVQKPWMTPRQFATLLRNLRRKHCLTQAQACVALGLPNDQGVISDSHRGKAFPCPPRLQQLVAALKQPPASGSGTHSWFVRAIEFRHKRRAWRKARGLRQLDACAVLGLPSDEGLVCRSNAERPARGERASRRIPAIIAGTVVPP